MLLRFSYLRLKEKVREIHKQKRGREGRREGGERECLRISRCSEILNFRNLEPQKRMLFVRQNRSTFLSAKSGN